MKKAIGWALAVSLIVIPFTFAQDKFPGATADDCMKHCRQMAEMRQKAMDEHKAQMDKMDAVFKEVRADLDMARTAKGDKKTAALQAAIEKMVSFHESMRNEMASMPAMRMGHPMMMGMSCCGGMAAMSDCPMMKGDAPKN
ncbi:MAG TPA: hypothetical protein VIA45_17840 [Thermoanaerobaculia bacterium]|jgi:formiminotetrahydrofolate cyclodeaminase